MYRLPKYVLVLAFAMAPAMAPAEEKTSIKGSASTEGGVLWKEPVDLESRDLFYGSGGKEHAPHGVFTFEEEDLDGTNPKFNVRDENGVKWKVKMGTEARPETAASRFVWALGYFTNEDYFVETLKVQNMPPKLKRGQHFVEADGTLHNVRMKRQVKGEEKIGSWRWKHAPMLGTQELDGLRVLMALMNNWDLKDQNNAIYSMPAEREPVYLISDLGSSFGTAGFILSLRKSRGNLDSYNQSKFIRKVRADSVDFEAPARPTWMELAAPHRFIKRVHLEWLGDDIPRDHVIWMAKMLARLSPTQLRDAFRGAGYSPDEVEGFATVVQGRIAQLNTL